MRDGCRCSEVAAICTHERCGGLTANSKSRAGDYQALCEQSGFMSG